MVTAMKEQLNEKFMKLKEIYEIKSIDEVEAAENTEGKNPESAEDEENITVNTETEESAGEDTV